MVTIEIITHCWNYTRCLAYQASSFICYPPQSVSIIWTVFYCAEDKPTSQLLVDLAKEPSWPGYVQINPICQPKRELLNRVYGRNQAALGTDAHYVWFHDANYWFGKGCLDSIPRFCDSLIPTDKIWFAPKKYDCSKDLGDKLIEGMPEKWDGPRAIPERAFHTVRTSQPRSGVYLVTGDTARELGYLSHTGFINKRYDEWPIDRTNIKYPEKIKRYYDLANTSGTKIEMPNLYHIRKNINGRFDKGARA